MTDRATPAATAPHQAASAVLMVRPAAFGWNPETSGSNTFQAIAPANGRDAAQRAVAEFDALATALTGAGVTVHAFADRDDPSCPDAVFPNNWVSFHADGSVVLYPMLARSRRLERRLDVLDGLAQRGACRIERLLDLTRYELQGRYLEGTGSIVFDHLARIAYACLSPRTDAVVLDELCAGLGYTPVTFTATDRAGVPVYHTNVALSIGTGYALLCAEAVPAWQRGALLERLAAHDRRVLTLDHVQMAAFAGNVLELRGAGRARVLAGSQRAFGSLAPAVRETLEACTDRIVAVPVPTIEELGGGSVRCMLAEVFLPPPLPATAVATTGADA